MDRRIIAATLSILLCASVAWGRMGLMVVGGTPKSAGAAAPEWGGELGRVYVTSDVSTTVITASSAVSAGGRIVVLISDTSAAQTVSSIADSSGNTYASDASFTVSGGYGSEIWSAPVTTALDASDTITITWATPSYTYRWAMACYITNVSGVDVTASNGSAYGQSVSIAGTTVEAKTALVGMVWASDSAASTYSGGSYTTESVHSAHRNTFYYHENFTSADSKNPNGSWDTFKTWRGAWVAYK